MFNIEVIEKEGIMPGKTTVVLAGVHGNEVPGIMTLKNLISRIDIKCGKVYFIYANLEAIKQNKRFIEKNLNRCFLKNQPTEIYNSLEGKTARELIPYLERADFMLDLHSSNIEDSLPFVIYDEKQIESAKIFDAEFITFNWDIFEPGSSDNYCNTLGTPCFCFEAGYSKDPVSVERAQKALLNFLVFTGNIQGEEYKRRTAKILKIKSLYINKEFSFKKEKYLPDFWRAEQSVQIGNEGDLKVFMDAGDFILFLRDSDNLNEECFLLAEETLINNKNSKEIGDKK